MDILVQDLVRSINQDYDDCKKTHLDRTQIVTNKELAITTLRELENITKASAYSPESLSFQAALEPLLCCLCSNIEEIRDQVLDILTYLLKDEDNRLILESQGYLPYLYQMLKFSQQKISKLILKLPIVKQTSYNSIMCDLCGTHRYVGLSYKCLLCNDWDYCALCYCLARHSRNHVQIKMQSRNFSRFIVQAREIVDSESLEHDEESKTHFHFSCAGCGLNPIHGVRYMCLTCGNNSLCQKCESNHNKSHVYLKFRYPLKNLEKHPESKRIVCPEVTSTIPPDAYYTPVFFPSPLSSDKALPMEQGKWYFYFVSPGYTIWNLEKFEIVFIEINDEINVDWDYKIENGSQTHYASVENGRLRFDYCVEINGRVLPFACEGWKDETGSGWYGCSYDRRGLSPGVFRLLRE